MIDELAMIDGLTGYAHPAYAASLSEVGQPRRLPRSGGWILERPIADTGWRDAVGAYPFFSCQDWAALAADLEELQGELVSLAAVPIAFGDYSEELLKGCFGDVCRPFKEHFVVDLSQEPRDFVSSHHRRNVRKALKGVTTHVCEDPAAWLGEWTTLYANLANRHQISGTADFSLASFRYQMEVPGLVVLRAEHEGELIGMILWYVQDSVAYYHLAAYSDAGYRLRASFGLFWASIEHFKGKVDWLGLGSNAGAANDADDGLARFKRGWSTGMKTVYLCGRVLDRERYRVLCGSDAPNGDFFPAYRRV